MANQEFETIGLLMESGDYSDAAAACRNAITALPNHPFPRIQLGIALDELGQREDAKVAFEGAVQCFGGIDRILNRFEEHSNQEGTQIRI
jgi:Flp pilus assembly protein TadD